MESSIIVKMKFVLMAISFALWAILYNRLRHKYPGRSPSFCNHFLTIIYAIFCLAFWQLTPNLQSFWNEPSYRGWDPINALCLINTWGYTALSLTWNLYYGGKTVVYSNYLLSLMLLNHYIFLKIDNREVIIRGLGYLELTNPSPHARCHLKRLGRDGSQFHKIVEIGTYSILALIRIIYGSQYVSKVLFNRVYDSFDKAVACYFYIIGIVLFWNVVPLWKRLFGATEKNQTKRLVI